MNSRPIIRPNMRRDSATQEQIRQDQQHVVRADPSGHHRGQTLACVLVENIENPEGPAVVRPIRHEVIRPDVIAVRRAAAGGTTHRRARVWLASAASLGTLRPSCRQIVYTRSLPTSQPSTPQEIRHSSVAIPPILLGQCDDPFAQPRSTRDRAVARTEQRTGSGRSPDTPCARTPGAP